MAGRPKSGLDFAGWNTDIFENDTKIDELIDAQGWIGFSIYFYLCQRAYASDGYFYRWSYANAATTARRMGGGIGSENVRQTVSTCLRIGLFDKRLFEEGVLTSRGIQRRYMEAIQKRSYKCVDHKLWLLKKEETKGLVLCTQNGDSLPEDGDSLPEDPPKSKVKESKVNDLSTDGFTKKIDRKIYFCDVMSLYREKVSPLPSPTDVEEIRAWVNQWNGETVYQVIEAACNAGNGNLNYIRGIINHYMEKGD